MLDDAMYVFKQLHSKAGGPAICSIKCHQDPKNTRNFSAQKGKEMSKTQGNSTHKRQGKNARKKRKETKKNKERKDRVCVDGAIVTDARDIVDSLILVSRRSFIVYLDLTVSVSCLIVLLRSSLRSLGRLHRP